MVLKKLLSSLKSLNKKSSNSSFSQVIIPSSSIVDDDLSSSLDDNLSVLQKEFDCCSDVVFRNMQITDDVKGLIVFIDGIVKPEYIQDNVLRPLLLHFSKATPEHLNPNQIKKSIVTLTQLSQVHKYTDIVNEILSGNAVLFIDGHPEALVLHVIGGNRRSVEEPESEVVIRGPREGFNESLRNNTALLRFKIKSSKLKMIPFVIGKDTKTNVILAYMEGIAEPKVIEEVQKRLKAIRIDGILESGYIEELIEDYPYSPFPQLRYSERPDTVAGQLLEGKFAIMVDGTPFVIKGPTTLWQMLQANEDYYERYMIGNLIRWLRYSFMAIALFLPALYIAVTTFHQDMLPTTLLLSVSAAREAIPFPALVEALIMEIAFEALREAGIRLPRTVGQAVSILGALVIGQAAVQAGIVSAPMVIVVSLTGIASFTIPHFNMAISIRMLRFPIMFLAGILGLLGIVVGVYLITLHLCQLKSFGVPYLTGFAPYRKNDMKDIFIRAPWWKMIFRPSSVQAENRKRMEENLQPATPEGEGG
jgi:spore germination protein